VPVIVVILCVPAPARMLDTAPRRNAGSVGCGLPKRPFAPTFCALASAAGVSKFGSPNSTWMTLSIELVRSRISRIPDHVMRRIARDELATEHSSNRRSSSWLPARMNLIRSAP
jgi:hypothetical protein